MEFAGTKSECCLNDRMLTVRYAGASVDTPWAVYGELRSSDADFDPDVPTTRVLDFALEGVDVSQHVPETAEVVVRDERPNPSPFWGGWIASTAVASVEVPVADVRARR